VLFDAETYRSLQPILHAADAPASTQAVVRQLCAYLAQLQLACAGEPFSKQIAARDAQPFLITADTQLSLEDAFERMQRSADREKRQAIERALDLFLCTATEPEERRLEAWATVPPRLGQPSLSALHQEVSGLEGESFAAAAGGFLKETQDAFADLLLFLLRRVAGLGRAARLSDVRWHDLRYLIRSSGLPGAPDAAGWVSAVEAWLEAWRLPSLRSGPVEHELMRPPSRSFSVAVRSGSSVRLLVALGSGPDGAASLLSTVADLQRLLHATPEDPVEARDLISSSVAHAHRALFRGLLAEEGWLKRFVPLPRETARDLARSMAALELLALRRQAGLFLYQRALFAQGPGPGMADRFVDEMQRAVGAPPPRGLYLSLVEPSFPSAYALEGALLGAQLAQHLRQEFDDDYFRNPAASEWLCRRFARGARETPESLQKAVGLKPEPSQALDFGPMVRPILTALNA
jgi:hypothetical protein